MRRSNTEPRTPGDKRGRADGGDHPGAEHPGTAAGSDPPDGAERGSAVVEFIFLSLLLMIPLVYFIITVGQLQGGSFAVVGAADQAAKIYVTQPDATSGRAAAEQAVVLALADYGHPAGNATIDTSCEPSDCMAPGAAVTVTVRLAVALPFVPFSDVLHLTAADLSASATQTMGRFR